jgi:hypothetical protein
VYSQHIRLMILCVLTAHQTYNTVCTHSTSDLRYCVYSQHIRLYFSSHTKELCELCCNFCNISVCYFACLCSCLMKTMHHLRKEKKNIFFVTRTEPVMQNFYTVLCLVLLHGTVSTRFFLNRTFGEILSLRIIYEHIFFF